MQEKQNRNYVVTIKNSRYAPTDVVVGLEYKTTAKTRQKTATNKTSKNNDCCSGGNGTQGKRKKQNRKLRLTKQTKTTIAVVVGLEYKASARKQTRKNYCD